MHQPQDHQPMTIDSPPHRRQGLFVGLTTLDLIYGVTQPPQPNQKLVASDYGMAAGGPATNAAIAFQHLSQQNSLPSSSRPVSTNDATILSVVGSHPIGNMVRADIEQWGVAIADLNPGHPNPVPTSSIMVTEATGERAVVSLNAVKSVATPEQIPDSVNDRWDQIGVILIDGHQMEVGEAIARRAHEDGIPVVIDGGSWKPGFENVLPYATYAICSANFYPPNCTTSTEVHHFLRKLGIPHVVITHGSAPITYWDNTSSESNQSPQLIPAPTISPIDTLGAGDIFHGAFCYYLLEAIRSMTVSDNSKNPSTSNAQQFNSVSHPTLDIPPILRAAAQVASKSCTFFGTRQWMQ